MENHKTIALEQNSFARSFIIFLALALLTRQLWWAIFGVLNVDEFENLHIIWLYDHGVVPYLDYFHSHLPLYNLLLYPIYALFGPSAELPGIARLTLFPIVLLTIWQIGWIGYRVTGSKILGWLTVLFFLSPPSIGSCLAEMRPDSVGLPIALFSVMLYLKYTQQTSTRPSKYYAAGFVLGLSLLFSHKPILLVLVLLWLFEQYHYRILKQSFSTRMRRLVLFSALVVFPYAIAVSILCAIGWLNLDNLRVVTATRMDMMITDLFFWIKKTLLLVTPLFNLIVFALGIIGSIRTKFWRGIRSDGLNAGLVLSGTYAIVGLLQLIALPVLIPHWFILPFIFLSALVAWQLKRASAAILVLVIAFAIIPPNLLHRDHFFENRTQQTQEFRSILNNIPPEVPVLDSMTGLGAFRFIVGRHMYYRPGFFGEEAYRQYNQIVARGLSKKEFGAVVTDELMFRAFPSQIQDLIEKNYRPSSYPDILLPSPGP